MYPSPLRDGGYDIADFYAIHPDYGTVEDFERFIDAAHQRGIRVIADLVMNHTSDEHPWFQESRCDRRPARSATGTCGPTPTSATTTRGSSSSTPSRRTGPGTSRPAQYYWHRFFSHQPDLNYDNPEVQDAMLEVAALLARPRPRRLPPRRRALPLRARGHQRREPAGDPRVPQAGAHDGRRRVPRPRAARRGQPVARRRRRVLRRRRRVPHGVPLPGDAAHVHGAAPRGRDADPRDPRRARRRSPTTASGASSCATTTS